MYVITHREKTEPPQVTPVEAMAGTSLSQCYSSVLGKIVHTVSEIKLEMIIKSSEA